MITCMATMDTQSDDEEEEADERVRRAEELEDGSLTRTSSTASPPGGTRAATTRPSLRSAAGELHPVALRLESGDDLRAMVALDLDDAVLHRRRPSRTGA